MRAFVALLLCLTCNLALGEWVYVNESEDGRVFFIDNKSIKKEGAIRRYWVLVNTTAQAPGPDGVMSVKAVNEIDCKKEKIRVLQESWWSKNDAKGENLTPNPYNLDQSWAFIAPDSAVVQQMILLCKRK